MKEDPLPSVSPPSAQQADLEARIEQLKQALALENDPVKRQHLIDALVDSGLLLAKLLNASMT